VQRHAALEVVACPPQVVDERAVVGCGEVDGLQLSVGGNQGRSLLGVPPKAVLDPRFLDEGACRSLRSTTAHSSTTCVALPTISSAA
jgi:hypothetical protein